MACIYNRINIKKPMPVLASRLKNSLCKLPEYSATIGIVNVSMPKTNVKKLVASKKSSQIL